MEWQCKPWSDCSKEQSDQGLHFAQAYLADHVGLFVCFVALRPKSTAMVIAGRSVHLTTLFPGQAWTSGYQ